jgi:hypothetical protein
VLSELAEKEFSAAGQVLAVNARPFAHAGAVRVSEVGEGETPPSGFDGAIWECQGDPVHGLRSLRVRVRPQGLVLVSVRLRMGPWQRLRSAFAGDAGVLPSLEALCAAPLLVGLEEPRVLLESAEFAVVSARVPASADPLDAHFISPFFTQPA